jgi:hypothetical protein
MNRWIRLAAAALLLTPSIAVRAEIPVTSCVELVMTAHDAEPETSQATSEHSWPDGWPDTSGREEEPPGT